MADNVRPTRNESLALKPGDPPPQIVNRLETRDFAIFKTPLSLFTLAYAGEIPWKGCFSVAALHEPNAERSFSRFFGTQKNSAGEAGNPFFNNLFTWNKFVRDLAADKTELCCETDIKKAAIDQGIAVSENFPEACRQSRAAVLAWYYASEIENEESDTVDRPIAECEPIDSWHQTRWGGSLLWSSILVFLTYSLWTEGGILKNRLWRPSCSLPLKTARAWPWPVQGLGGALKYLGTRALGPIALLTGLLVLTDLLYSRFKDPKCGKGFLKSPIDLVLDRLIKGSSPEPREVT